MDEKKWAKSTDPASMLESHAGTASARKLRLFAVACCRPLVPKGHHYQDALDIAERAADGQVKRSAARLLEDSDTLAMEAGDPLGYAMHHALDPDFTGQGIDRGFVDWVAGMRKGSTKRKDRARFAGHLRCLFGNPFRPVAFDPGWRTSMAVGLAKAIDADRAFDRLPVLADALQDAGCEGGVMPGEHGAAATSLTRASGSRETPTCW